MRRVLLFRTRGGWYRSPIQQSCFAPLSTQMQRAPPPLGGTHPAADARTVVEGGDHNAGAQGYGGLDFKSVITRATHSFRQAASPRRPLLIDADQMVVLSLLALKQSDGLAAASSDVLDEKGRQLVDEFVRLAGKGLLKFDASLRSVRWEHFWHLIQPIIAKESQDTPVTSIERSHIMRIFSHLYPHISAETIPIGTLCAMLSVAEGCDAQEKQEVEVRSGLLRFVARGLRAQLIKSAKHINLEVDLIRAARGFKARRLSAQSKREMEGIMATFTEYLSHANKRISTKAVCNILGSLGAFNLCQGSPYLFFKACTRLWEPHQAAVPRNGSSRMETDAPPPPITDASASNEWKFCTSRDVLIAISGLESTISPARGEGRWDVMNFLRSAMLESRELPFETLSSELFRALLGLKRVNSKATPVQDIIRFLSEGFKLQSQLCVKSDLSNDEVVLGLYGIRHLESRDKYVLDLIDGIASVLEQDITSSNTRWKALQPNQLSFLLFSFSGKASSSSEVRRMVEAVGAWIKSRGRTNTARNSATGMKSSQAYRSMCISLYGLHSLDSSIEEVHYLLREVLEAFRAYSPQELLAERSVASPSDISLALFGFRNMSSNCNVVRELLKVAVLPLLGRGEIDPSVQFSSQDVTMSLSGLRYLNFNHAEAQQIVAGLVRHFRQSKIALNEREISMCLNAMQNMPSQEVVVRELAKVLVPMFPVPVSGNSAPTHLSISHALNAQSVAMAVYGFRFMSSDYPEVRALVGRLADIIAAAHSRSSGSDLAPRSAIKSNDLALTDQGVVMCLHSLRYLSSEHAEVRRLLGAITPLIDKSKYALTPVDILNCLRGLKRMQSSVPEVKALLSVIREKISGIRDGGARLWYDEIFRTDVYGSDKLMDDIRYYSRKSPDFREILQSVMQSS